MTGIKLLVNGERREFENRSTILDIIKSLGLKPEIVAIELNGQLLRRDDYDSAIVSDGDKLEYLYYMAGGDTTEDFITKRARFSFPITRVKDPIIYYLVKKFDLIPNIRRASIETERGWVVLEISGTSENLDRGFDFVRSYGVDIEPIEGDVLEG
ncbi:MAG: sulfur carrier protein ThiS [Rubrobacteridae bacterium]|nr:sulfur carrier protein ThiS [Rubrobacteridae bacterium]